jgi:hypothetical protein
MESNAVADSHLSGRLDYGVCTGAGKQARIADRDPVMPSEGAQDIAVFWEFVLSEGRHHASRIGKGHAKSYYVTNGEFMTDPTVLDEPILFGGDDQVHPEPALVESALRSKLGQSLEGGRRQDGYRKQVEKQTDGHRGRKTGFGEEGRSKLLFDNCISVACGV